jgi:hypothetical protein
MKLVHNLSIALIAIVLASACSSGSSKASPPPSTVALTKASYIVKANALCRTMNNRTRALPDPGNDPKKAAATIDQGSAIVRQTLQRLRELPVPPGEGPKLSTVYAKVDTLLQDLAAYSAALRSGDQQAAIAAGKKIDAAQARANSASVEYGLTVCGS